MLNNGSIWNKILIFALPVAATAILEQLFNASDIAVVGNFTASDKTIAVAAVGANSSIIALIVNLFVAIALGTNVIIANAIGQDDKEKVKKAVHTSVLIAVIGGIAISILGEIFSELLLSSLNVLNEVFPSALMYLRIYLLGMPVILLFNLFFVAILYMTVDGVAIATVVSNVFSSVLIKLIRSKEYIGIELKLLMNSFSQACTTFVGQNYGAKKLPRCRRILLICLAEDIIVTAIAIATILFTGKYLLAFFNNDPEVINLGYIRLVVILSAYTFSMLYDLMSGYLRGFGISLVPAMLTTIIGVCGVRIVWIAFVFTSNPTFQTILMAYPVSLSATAVMIAIALFCYHPIKRF